MEILESLEKDDPDDRKIKQNLAVARFYAGGAIEELYGTLNAVKWCDDGCFHFHERIFVIDFGFGERNHHSFD